MAPLKFACFIIVLTVLVVQSNSYPLEEDYFDEDWENEGDDILPDIRDKADGLKDEDYRWPNAVLVYRLTSHYDKDQKHLIHKAHQKISENTCVKFREYQDGDEDYVEVYKPDHGCSSHAGRQGGPQKLKLSDGCFKTPNKKTHKSDWGSVAHEFIHALGFHHEQCRPDRDQYVTINWENISKKHQHNYNLSFANQTLTFDLPYDYDSIMHYNRYEFAINRTEDAMTPKQKLPDGAFMGQREHLSQGDIDMINKMYNCS